MQKQNLACRSGDMHVHTPSWDDLWSSVIGWATACPQELSIWHHVWQSCWPTTEQGHTNCLLFYSDINTHYRSSFSSMHLSYNIIVLLLSSLLYRHGKMKMGRELGTVTQCGRRLGVTHCGHQWYLYPPLPAKSLSPKHKAHLIGWASVCLAGPYP